MAIITPDPASGILDVLYMSNSGPHNTGPGDMIDTAKLDRLIFNVSWSGLSAAPTTTLFGVHGSNDPTATTLIVPLGEGFVSFFGGNFSRPGAIDILGPTATAGAGIIAVQNMPRYVAMSSYFLGSFTGTSTIRAYGFVAGR